ncbi:hypothetical protein [Amycolatopsis sp. cmx-8-4]|uniref:hypothetical protein n=1 Tax=Amycolatopsis sp. cmx-8-4 TaxID=2790947 RepID=UPI00397E0BB8
MTIAVSVPRRSQDLGAGEQAERKMRNALAERGRGKTGKRCWTTCRPSSPTRRSATSNRRADPGRTDRVATVAVGGGAGRAAVAAGHGHLAAREGSYGYLHQFTPQVLAAVRFAGRTAAIGLLDAVEIVREPDATGTYHVERRAGRVRADSVARIPGDGWFTATSALVHYIRGTAGCDGLNGPRMFTCCDRTRRRIS